MLAQTLYQYINVMLRDTGKRYLYMQYFIELMTALDDIEKAAVGIRKILQEIREDAVDHHYADIMASLAQLSRRTDKYTSTVILYCSEHGYKEQKTKRGEQMELFKEAVA